MGEYDISHESPFDEDLDFLGLLILFQKIK